MTYTTSRGTNFSRLSTFAHEKVGNILIANFHDVSDSSIQGMLADWQYSESHNICSYVNLMHYKNPPQNWYTQPFRCEVNWVVGPPNVAHERTSE